MSTYKASDWSISIRLEYLGVECQVGAGRIKRIKFVDPPPLNIETDLEFRRILFDWLAKHEIKAERVEDLVDWNYSPFVEKVLREIMKIEPGRITSYKNIAKAVGNGKAARAVGQALKSNRTPILVPCHRVIRESGDIGGFSGGLEWKRYLLKIERSERMSR